MRSDKALRARMTTHRVIASDIGRNRLDGGTLRRESDRAWTTTENTMADHDDEPSTLPKNMQIPPSSRMSVFHATGTSSGTVAPERRLWQIDDGGEHFWIMAPTEEKARKLFFERCADGRDDEEPIEVTDATNRAHTIMVRDDERAGAPSRSARSFMEECDSDTDIIGASVW